MTSKRVSANATKFNEHQHSVASAMCARSRHIHPDLGAWRARKDRKRETTSWYPDAIEGSRHGRSVLARQRLGAATIKLSRSASPSGTQGIP